VGGCEGSPSLPLGSGLHKESEELCPLCSAPAELVAETFSSAFSHQGWLQMVGVFCRSIVRLEFAV